MGRQTAISPGASQPLRTDNALDMAINGQGFFQIQMPNGEINYTRDGSFQISDQGDQIGPQLPQTSSQSASQLAECSLQLFMICSLNDLMHSLGLQQVHATCKKGSHGEFPALSQTSASRTQMFEQTFKNRLTADQMQFCQQLSCVAAMPGPVEQIGGNGNTEIRQPQTSGPAASRAAGCPRGTGSGSGCG